MTSAPPVVELQNITFRYPGSEATPPVLEDVSLTVEVDDYLGLVGPNGGGKTTLLKIMLGLLKPDRGKVTIFGHPPAEVRHRIGYVPQHAEVDTSIPATVLDIVLTGRLGRTSWGMRFGREHVGICLHSLAQTGVENLARHSLGELSGGQRQRVLIARALASEAEILLLDEPTAGVDAPSERSFHELLMRLSGHLPIVVVSHDISFVSSHLKTIACLNRRMVCHGASEMTAPLIPRAYADPDAVVRLEHSDDCPASHIKDGTCDNHEPGPGQADAKSAFPAPAADTAVDTAADSAADTAADTAVGEEGDDS